MCKIKAGRPKLPPGKKKVGIYIKLPPSLITWMDAQPESRAKLIEERFKDESKK
jgi:hypothetical protein